MRRRFPLFAIFIVLYSSGLNNLVALAQNTATTPRSSNVKPHARLNRNDDQEVTLPDDMRIKMAIARDEDEYKKILEDVDKLSGLRRQSTN